MPFRAKAKENGTVMSEEARERRTKLAVSSSASAVNFVLGVMKVLAGVWTNSLSILTDGVNNFGDVLSNAGAAVGFAVEKKAPTKRFPGGFGRVEYVVSFVMAIIIMAVGGGFMYSALDRVFYHPVVTFAWTQFGIVAATIVVKIGLGRLHHDLRAFGALSFPLHTVPRGRLHRHRHQRRDDRCGAETCRFRFHETCGRSGLQACKRH